MVSFYDINYKMQHHSASMALIKKKKTTYHSNKDVNMHKTKQNKKKLKVIKTLVLVEVWMVSSYLSRSMLPPGLCGGFYDSLDKLDFLVGAGKFL